MPSSCAALGRALDRYLATAQAADGRGARRLPLSAAARRLPPRSARAARTRRAFAKFQRPGVYETTVTQPRHFRSYLLEQLEPLVAEYGAEIEVGVSDQEIPYPYVLERVDEHRRRGVTAGELARHFPTPLLAARRRRDRRRPVGGARRASRARSRCSTRCASTTRCAGSCTTRAATGATCSTGSCSPTITATSTSSCAGAWSSSRADGPYERLVLPGGVEIRRGNIRRRSGEGYRREPLAPLPDAGLSPRRAATARA